ncbi:hypothetical protein BDR22DRAFT_889290 [Usnea florida]
MNENPVFQASSSSNPGQTEEPHEPVLKSRWLEWVKRLAGEAGFVRDLTPHCLHRAPGSATNDDHGSNEAVRTAVPRQFGDPRTPLSPQKGRATL